MKKRNKTGVVPELSVIIPTFQRAKILFPTLVCLTRQTLSPTQYEVIIVDSGDDVETPTMMATFFPQAPFRYHRISTCRNRSLLRNTGAQMARGKVLLFLDNDILTPVSFLERHLLAHQAQKRLIYLGARNLLSEFDPLKFTPSHLISRFEDLSLLPFHLDEREAALSIAGPKPECPWRFVYSHSLSVRREDFMAVGGFDQAYGDHWGWEDIDLGMVCSQAGWAIKVDLGLCGFHQPHPVSDSSSQHRINDRRALRKHPFFEVELYTFFNNRFAYLYALLKPLIPLFERLPSPANLPPGSLMLGCLRSMDRQGVYPSLAEGEPRVHCLGVFLMDEADQSVPAVFFHPVILHFDPHLQAEIFEEGLRVSNTLYLPPEGKSAGERLLAHANASGVWEGDHQGYPRLVIRTRGRSRRWLVFLPSPIPFLLRYRILSVAEALIASGQDVLLVDYRDREFSRTDERRLDDSTQRLLEDRIVNYIPVRPRRRLVPASLIDDGSVSNLDRWTLVVSDRSHQGFDLLGFHSALFPAQAPQEDPSSFRFIAELALDPRESNLEGLFQAFSQVVKTNPRVTLDLKLPIVETLMATMYTRHNEVERRFKSAELRKAIADLRTAVTCLKHTYGVEGLVSVVEEEVKLVEYSRFWNRYDTLIVSTVFPRWEPAVLEALATGLRVISPRAALPPGWEGDHVLTVESKTISYHSWFSTRPSLANYAWTVEVMDTSDWAHRLQEAAASPAHSYLARRQTAAKLADTWDWSVVTRSLEPQGDEPTVQ